MAVQPYMYAKLTDDTTSVEFRLTSNVGYMMVRDDWAPAIAPLRAGELGGRGPYEEVAEEFTIDIVGTSPADALTKLRTLNLLLEQATRFYRWENVAPVRFEYAPRGSTTLSTLSPLKYAVYGRAPGDTTNQSHLIVDQTFNGGLAASVIRGVRVKFWRHGIGTATQATASSGATNNGSKTTVLISSENVPSPTKVSISNFGYGNGNPSKFGDSFVVVAENEQDIQVISAESLVPATDYASIADASSNALGNVLQFTPSATTERTSSVFTSSTLLNKNRIWAVYANIRNNSATTEFKVRVSVEKNYVENWTPYLVVPGNGGTAFPSWHFLGQVAIRKNNNFYLKIGITALTASGSLDIDSIVLVEVLNPNNSVLAVSRDMSTLVIGIDTLIIDHQLYSQPQAAVYPELTPGNFRNFLGNAFISIRAIQPAVLLMGTGSANNSLNYWRQSDAMGNVLQNTWTMVRDNGHLTPP